MEDEDIKKLARELKGDSLGGKVKKVLSLGGPLPINRKLMKELHGMGRVNVSKFYGVSEGDLWFRLGHKEEVAVEATQSDTKRDLISELVNQGGLTRKEAEETVNNLIRRGVLVEVDTLGLGKVLVFKGGSH